jgi:CRP/FNR family transcriptional regulator
MKDLIKKNFSQLQEPALLDEIVAKAKLMSFEEGTEIVKKGAYVKVVPLVCSGIVKVLQEGEEHDMLMYYIEKGESCIMSINACFKNEKSKIKAVIEEDAEILVVPSEAVVKWAATYPSWNVFITSLYSKRFLNLLDGFNSVVYDKIEDRLNTYLLNKSELLGTKELKVTHRKVAEDLGKAREVISRLLKVMEDEKKIRLERGKIILINL